MPISSSTSLSIKPQFSTPGLVATQSMQAIAESINEICLESIRRIAEDISRIAGIQSKIMTQAIAASFSLDGMFPKGLFNFIPPTPFKTASLGIFGETNIVEGEIEEVRQFEAALLPATIPVPSRRSKMGLRHISGGNFSFRRKTLMGLSLRNREGKLMDIMLENPDLFVSDEVIDEKFYTKDILERSNLIKLLKNKFKLNKLKAVIKRQGDGYILININPLYVN